MKNLINNKARKLFLIVLLSGLFSGCSSTPFSEGIGGFFKLPAIDPETDKTAVLDQQSTQVLSDQLNEFITSAQNGEIARIEQSPWSTNHDIMAQEFYHSASGKQCRTLRLMHGIKDLPNKQYVCEVEPGNWVPIRCISR